MTNSYLFTSESVAPGHPDKICDQISDQILDVFLSHDPQAKVAVECMAAANNLIIAGEVNSIYRPSIAEIEEVARNKIHQIGYIKDPFAWDRIRVQILLNRQSPEITHGVEGGADKEEGAGDQGIMFGYACDETEVFMPATIYYAHRLIKSINEAVKAREILGLGPDGKSQVTLRYNANGKPIGVDTVVVSIQHPVGVSPAEVKEMIMPIIVRTFPSNWYNDKTQVLVNPAGLFTIGGPDGDTGLTGRKIIVDTYGGSAPHGGGAFSGKDPSKVDRSAAYFARFLAKNIVAHGMAKKCLIQLSYAIGVAQPTSLYINTFGTSQVDERKLEKQVSKDFALSPRGIRNLLRLDRPIYGLTSIYGHFGRNYDGTHFTWEEVKDDFPIV
jgi:S-adenosylmethionine synthetase